MTKRRAIRLEQATRRSESCIFRDEELEMRRPIRRTVRERTFNEAWYAMHHHALSEQPALFAFEVDGDAPFERETIRRVELAMAKTR